MCSTRLIAEFIIFFFSPKDKERISSAFRRGRRRSWETGFYNLRFFRSPAPAENRFRRYRQRQPTRLYRVV